MYGLWFLFRFFRLFFSHWLKSTTSNVHWSCILSIFFIIIILISNENENVTTRIARIINIFLFVFVLSWKKNICYLSSLTSLRKQTFYLSKPLFSQYDINLSVIDSGCFLGCRIVVCSFSCRVCVCGCHIRCLFCLLRYFCFQWNTIINEFYSHSFIHCDDNNQCLHWSYNVNPDVLLLLLYKQTNTNKQTNKIHILLLLLFVIQANKQTSKQIFDDIEIKNFYEFVIKCETNKYRWETNKQQQNNKNDNNNGQMIICI